MGPLASIKAITPLYAGPPALVAAVDALGPTKGAAHEGWQPNRSDVEVQVRRTRGEITHDELLAFALKQ